MRTEAPRARLLVAAAVWLAACAPAAHSEPTPEPTSLPIGSGLAPPTLPQVAAASPAPCGNDARFLEDLTIPDGMVVAPGERLVKKWAVQNIGTCDWGPAYRLVWVEGDPEMRKEEQALYPARAGAAARWEVVLQAPGTPGEYRSVWQARAPDGMLFGDVVFVSVVVEGSPNP